MMTTNLPSGYHRDLQLLKEHLFPAFQTLKDCLSMAQLMLENIQVQENIMADEKYKYAFSVEAVNELVLQGVPFRDAYKQVGLTIEAGNFEHSAAVNHVHEGSIGNLCNDQVNRMMQEVLNGFGFEQTENAIAALLQNK
jgi:argininosuccinate lyase